MTKESGLTPKLLEVAQMLASGLTYSQISEAVSVPRSTIGRWAKMDSVKLQVEALKAEALEACKEVSREAATESAQDLQGKLALSAKRQEALNTKGYALADECYQITQLMAKKVKEVVKEVIENNKLIEPHEKCLINSFPHYAKVCENLLTNLGYAEDRLYAIEEISRRLDEWGQINNSQN
jgi:hypothetical protein